MLIVLSMSASPLPRPRLSALNISDYWGMSNSWKVSTNSIQASGNSPIGYGPGFFGDPGIRSWHTAGEEVQQTAQANLVIWDLNLFYHDIYSLWPKILAAINSKR